MSTWINAAVHGTKGRLKELSVWYYPAVNGTWVAATNMLEAHEYADQYRLGSLGPCAPSRPAGVMVRETPAASMVLEWVRDMAGLHAKR